MLYFKFLTKKQHWQNTSTPFPYTNNSALLIWRVATVITETRKFPLMRSTNPFERQQFNCC